MGSLLQRRCAHRMRQCSLDSSTFLANFLPTAQRLRHRPLSPSTTPLRHYSCRNGLQYVSFDASKFHPSRRQSNRMISFLPEALWGASGFILKTLHTDGVVPYWACFALISVSVRVALFPLVLYGAQTASRFAKVLPEVQFLLSLFQNDMKKMRHEKRPLVQRMMLMRTNMSTLGGIYKLHKINPFSVFLSPLLQLPIFWYVSVDLRKIVNGLDPILAQQLVDSSIAWVPDLTEPDPWFGLPVVAGLVMYWNMEVALGRHSLTGPAASKSDMGVLLKDLFQSFAVFMPCFTCHLPSGVQIYLVTSFLFTLGQSTALRTESFRLMVGLPSMLAPPPEPKYAKEFIELKKLEQQAREIRGDGPVLGKGVLANDLTVSFPGQNRKSTIQVLSAPSLNILEDKRPTMSVQTQAKATGGPFIHGISLPTSPQAELKSSNPDSPSREYMPEISDEVMDKANRGELPIATKFVELPKAPSGDTQLNVSRFQKGQNSKPGKKRRK